MHRFFLLSFDFHSESSLWPLRPPPPMSTPWTRRNPLCLWLATAGTWRYNCRVFVLNGKVLMIRPKQFWPAMATTARSAGSHPGRKSDAVEDFLLPQCIRLLTGTSCRRLRRRRSRLVVGFHVYCGG